MFRVGHAYSQTAGIRAEPFSSSPGFVGGGFDGGRNMAILRYVGATVADPTTTQGAIVNPFIESKLTVRINC